MAQEVDYLKLLSNLNIKALQYAFRDRKTKKEHLGHYG